MSMPMGPFPWPPAPVPLTPVELPVGTVLAFLGDLEWQREPLRNQGWLVCDGSLVDRRQYPELFAGIGYQYSQKNEGVGFNLPDLRGQFLRGVDPRPASESNDPDSDTRVLANGTKGPRVGSAQDSALQSHLHQYKPELSATAPSGAGEGGSAGVNSALSSAPLDDQGNPLTNLSQGETRPRNVYVYFIIKSARVVSRLPVPLAF